MRWSEIDIRARVWQIPGRRTKNGKPHAVHLSEDVIAAPWRRCRDAASWCFRNGRIADLRVLPGEAKAGPGDGRQ